MDNHKSQSTVSAFVHLYVNRIPACMRYAISAGIGLCLGFIGLNAAGILVDNPTGLIKLGPLRDPAPLLAALGFLLAAILSYHRVFGAIAISIGAISVMSWGLVEVHGNSTLAAARTGLIPACAIAGALLYVAMLLLSGSGQRREISSSLCVLGTLFIARFMYA